jgi:hypothetical protein
MMMLSARSRKNPVFLSGELSRVLGSYLASILAGYDGGVCKIMACTFKYRYVVAGRPQLRAATGERQGRQAPI